MWVPCPSALPALSIYPSAKNKDPLRAEKRHMKQSCHHYCTQGRHNQSTTVLRYFSVMLCRQPLGTDESCYGPSPGTVPSLQQKNQFIQKAKTRSRVCCSQSTAVPNSSQLGSIKQLPTLRDVPMRLLMVSLQTQPVCQIPPSVSPSPRSIC